MIKKSVKKIIAALIGIIVVFSNNFFGEIARKVGAGVVEIFQSTNKETEESSINHNYLVSSDISNSDELNMYEYNLMIDKLTEDEVGEKTTYNIYAGAFIWDEQNDVEVERNINLKKASKERERIELKIKEKEDLYYEIGKRYIEQVGKENYQITIKELENIKKTRICIFEGIDGGVVSINSVTELKEKLKEKMGIDVNIVAYNTEIDNELKNIKKLIYDKKYKIALDGLLKLRQYYYEYGDNFSDYDEIIIRMILTNDKLKELYTIYNDNNLKFFDEKDEKYKYIKVV